MDCNSLVLLLKLFLILLGRGLQKFDGVLDLLMLLDGSSSGSESLLKELEGSLIDLLDTHLE